MAPRALLGRTAELRRLYSFIRRAETGFAALVIAGEAGIGKTTLWEETVRDAAAHGFTVLACRAAEHEEALAYVALSDLLADSHGVLPRLPRPQREAVEAALLVTSTRSPDQRAVGRGVAAALRAHAAEKPILVAVDDAQWLDSSTVRVLVFALRRLRAERVRLIATVRLGEDALLLARSSIGVEGELLELGALDPTTIEAVVTRTLGLTLLPPALAELYAASGGNPFYAIELAKEALRTGRRLAGAEPLPLPGNLRDLVGARIGRLEAQARDVLLTVACLSRPTATLIELALGRESRAGLAVALEGGIVEFHSGRLRFSHPLLASAVYTSSSASERRRIHSRLAEIVSDAEERGRHLALGNVIPDAGVAANLDAAADSARARGANDAAATLMEHALRLTPPEDEAAVARRAMKAADDYFLIGESDRSTAVVETVAERMEAGPARARVFRRLARARGSTAGFAAVDDLLSRALADAGDDESTRALIEHDLGLAFQQYGRLDDAARHCDEAVRLARACADADLLERAHVASEVLRFQRGEGLPDGAVERALAYLREPLVLGAEREPSFLAVIHSWAFMLKYADRFDTSRALLRRLQAAMHAEGGEGVKAPVLFHLAELECWSGNLDAARHIALELRRTVARSGQHGVRTRAAYAAALVDAHLGLLDRAQRLAREHLAVAERAGDAFLAIRFHAVLGFAALSAGDPAAAAQHLRHASARSEAAGYREPGLFRFAGDEIEALTACGEYDAARVSLELLEERAERLNRMWACAAAARARALLVAASGDVDGAIEIARSAVERYARLEQPLEHGRAVMALGIVLRRIKRRRESREALMAALETFARIGAAAWTERASTELARISGRAPRPRGLTPTEEQVAQLVAAGRANKEVAAEVHLSVKAVEANLSRVYRKLDVRSRSELVARLGGRRASTP